VKRRKPPRTCGLPSRPVIAYLLGDLAEEALFKAAATGDVKAVAGQTMAAHFHAGQRRLLEGDAAGAREHFQKCAATKLFQYAEVAWAQDELRALDKK
jgi:lipoprotein NlpI